MEKAPHVRFDEPDRENRPVTSDADSRSSVREVPSLEIISIADLHPMLFYDLGHGLEECLTPEQFT